MDMLALTLAVDPACPWCWLTERWLREAATVRPLEISYQLLSLARINGRDDPSPAGPLALLAAAREHDGNRAVAALYQSLAHARHEESLALGDEATLQRALASAHLPSSLLERTAGEEFAAAVQRDHDDAVQRGAFGVPSLSLDGAHFVYGPILDRRVEAEAAGELWDHVQFFLRQGHFFELKRERGPTVRPEVGTLGVASAG